MIISVNKECMNFINQVGLTTGEYNAHELVFKFTPDYNNLIKFAVFQNVEKIYKVKVENDKVVIPWEVLEDEGNLYIGVYGYEMEGNNLKLRYSPKPIQTNVSKGSFIEKGSNTEPLTPTDKEVIFSELNNIDLKTRNISDGVEIEMTNPKGETTKSVVHNGKDGKAGKDGSDYVITEEDYQEIANVVEGQITIPTKTSELQNDSNFVTDIDYATSSTGGVVKVDSSLYGSNIIDGKLCAGQTSYTNYVNKATGFIIGKGTLENVIRGKRLNTNYSVTETVVGTFLNKPLYRKVIQVTKDEYQALPTGSNSRKLLDVSSLNVDNLVNAILCCNYSDVDGFHNKTSYMHRTDTNGYELGCHEIKANFLNFIIGNSILTALVGNAIIILEYTKTTD